MFKRLRYFYSKIVVLIQKFLGIDASYFIKGGFYGVLQQVVGVISGLVIAYSFGHFAPRSVFGEYNLALSIVSLLAIVSLPGMNVSLLRSIGKEYDASLYQAVKAKFKWSFLGVPLLIGISYYYKTRGSDVFPSLLLVMALLFPWMNAFQATQSFFVGKKRFDLQAKYSSISSVLTAGLVSLLVITTNNLTLIMLGYFLGIILPSIFSFIYSKQLIKNKKIDKELLPYGYFLTGLQILPTAAAQLSNILLAAILGVDKLAVFSVATKIPGMVQKNFDVFYKPVTAKLANQSIKQHRLTLKTHLFKFVISGILMFGVIWIFLPTIISALYGKQYFEAVNYARLYSLALLPMPIIWLFGDIMNFQKLKKPIAVISTIVPVAKLIAYVIVIPRWQITGLIVIMLAERIFTACYSAVAVLKIPALRKT